MAGKHGRTVSQRRDGPAVRTADRHRPAPASPIRPAPPTTETGRLLQLQALAGNRAVGDLIEAGSGQRDRAADHRASSRQQAPVIVAQRAESPRKSVEDMTPGERLVEAIRRSHIGEEVVQKILSLVTPESLLIVVGTSLAVFAAAQLTPVGWAADIAIALTGIFVGAALYTAITHLVRFAAARNAHTEEELDQAGHEFGQAIAEIGVDAVILVLTHGLGRGGQAPPSSGGTPPTGAVAVAVTGDGVRLVAASTVPEALAAELGLRAMGPAATMTTAVHMAMTGPPGKSSGSPPSGGSGSKKTPGLESGPPPKIELGEIKPIKSYVAGLYQLNWRGARGNDALVTFDNAGNVNLQVFGDPKGTGVKRIIWEDNIGRVTPPPGATPGTAEFGNQMEPLVRDLVSETMNQSFKAKPSNAPGPDLVPTRRPR